MLSPEEVLKEHPFFEGISDEHLEFLVSVASPLHIEANRFLFRQGSSADCFLVLHNGDMALELHVGAKGARIIQTVGPGEVVGWSWLYPPHRWMYDGRALNTIDCLCLNGEQVRTRMADDHDLGYEILNRFGDVIVQALNRTRLQLLDVYGNGG
jgi:CRP-like cAMP-binding protein